MIHLMLEDNGGKTSYRILMFTPLFIPITQNNPLRTLDIPTQIGYRQTPLTAKLLSRRASEYLGIEKKLKRLALFVKPLYRHHSAQNAHLRSCYAYTLVLGILDRREHTPFEQSELLGKSHTLTHLKGVLAQEQRVRLAGDTHYRHNIAIIFAYQCSLGFTKTLSARYKHHCTEQKNKNSSHLDK